MGDELHPRSDYYITSYPSTAMKKEHDIYIFVNLHNFISRWLHMKRHAEKTCSQVRVEEHFKNTLDQWNFVNGFWGSCNLLHWLDGAVSIIWGYGACIDLDLYLFQSRNWWNQPDPLSSSTQYKEEKRCFFVLVSLTEVFSDGTFSLSAA